MADPKIPTKRKAITLSTVTLERLQRLAMGGWYGPDAAGIASQFVEDGLRRARESGYLPDIEDKGPKST